jgi:hypothetical protein
LPVAGSCPGAASSCGVVVVVVSVEVVVVSPFFFAAMWCGVVCRTDEWAPNCWWRVPPEWMNTTTVRESAHQSKRTTSKRKQGFAQLSITLSLCIQCVPSMDRGRIFIGDGSPTTLRYYTVIPPNNYIPGIFSGHNRIFTLLSRLHPGPFLPIGPITAHRA